MGKKNATTEIPTVDKADKLLMAMGASFLAYQAIKEELPDLKKEAKLLHHSAYEMVMHSIDGLPDEEKELLNNVMVETTQSMIRTAKEIVKAKGELS